MLSDFVEIVSNHTIATIVLSIPLFLCWGSFLNVVAFRLLHQKSFFTKRSQCPSCNHIIAWYDLVPLISWILLHARCRYCNTKISWLYPLVELLTGLLLALLVIYSPSRYWLGYGILLSALIITIRTDLEKMMILRLGSVWLIPVGLVLSFLEYLPITIMQSALGVIAGYGILWCVRTIFWYIRKQEGMGEGDLELLAGIGAFVGPVGIWYTILYGSITGSIVGIILSIVLKQKIERLPFGPFLALGAIIVVLFTSF